MSQSVDIGHLAQWIGRQDVASELLTGELVRRFAATLELGEVDSQDGAAAPALVHLCLSPPVAPMSALGPDGHPARGGFLPPVPLPRRMWAGGAFTFDAPLKIGQVVTRRSTVADVRLKEGRSGALCFVTVNHAIEADGVVCLSERQDIVYRGAEGAGPASAAAAAPAGSFSQDVAVSPTLLFRYSALTFNGHRIHYDHPYATGVENYPGLVVHGPMQATMLLHFAARLKGMPGKFEFRSLSPLFDNAPMALHAREDGDTLSLWTARPDGPVAMQATASW